MAKGKHSHFQYYEILWPYKIIIVYSQQLHLLHLFERLNVPASAFPWSFQFIPWKTALQGNYFATLFPCKIFQEIYFVTLFPCKWQKTNWKTKFFNRDTMEKIWQEWDLNPQPSNQVSTALSIELWSLDENHNFFVNLNQILKKIFWIKNLNMGKGGGAWYLKLFQMLEM